MQYSSNDYEKWAFNAIHGDENQGRSPDVPMAQVFATLAVAAAQAEFARELAEAQREAAFISGSLRQRP
jgi:hypothetical protein